MKRRTFIGKITVYGASLGCAVGANGFSSAFAARQNRTYDLLLKGGHVIDPANNINTVMDVAVSDGKISCVESGIPVYRAEKTIDVSAGNQCVATTNNSA